MVDFSLPLFQHTPHVWDAEKCEFMSKRVARDGLGTPYPWPGYIGSSTSIPPAFGSIRYNGGCERNGQWWQGEHFPFPVIAEGYEIISVLAWGWRIRRIGENKVES